MKSPGAGVMFVGEYPSLSASVSRVLNSAGCEIRYAASCEQALAALEERTFRVVLSKTKLADGSAKEMIPAIESASGWLFLSFPVEDGCWWIPVMQNGQLCVEAVALHSREFSKVLVNIVKGMLTAESQEAAPGSSTRLVEVPRRVAYAAGSY